MCTNGLSSSGKIPKNGIKIPKLFRSSGGSVLVFVSYYKHFPPKSRMRAKKTSMGTASGNLTSVSVTSDPALGVLLLPVLLNSNTESQWDWASITVVLLNSSISQ